MASTAEQNRERLARLLKAKAAAPRVFPLSFAQERLWFLDQLQPGNSAYNIASVTRLDTRLDAGLLSRAVDEIVARHEALRTVFEVVDGQPRQRVLPELHLNVTVDDLSSNSPADVAARRRREVETPFSLTEGPLLRVTLLEVGEGKQELLLTFHHIVIDGWSFRVFFDEIDRLYRAFARGQESPLPPPALQYPDWAQWQRESLTEDRVASEVAYWRGALEGAPTVLDLPSDRIRPPRQSLRGASHHARLEREVAERLFALGQTDERATPFMTLLAAFSAFLHRYSGDRDLVVGTPVANRSRTDVEQLIGLFLNTIALRVRVAPDDSFRTVLQRTRAMTLEAYAHQELPFEKLVEELRPVRDLSYTPLFQTMFVLQSAPRDRQVRRSSDAPPPVVTTSKFDLSLNAYEHSDGVELMWEYSTDLFDPPTIARLAAYFDAFVRAACDAPDRPLADLPLVRSSEGCQETPLAPERPRRETASASEAFRAQAARAPEEWAVELDGDRVSYGALVERVRNCAAALVHDAGAGPGSVVGICVDAPLDVVVWLLAVLECGGVCLPLDPRLPRDRLEALAVAASPVAVVTQRRHVERLANIAPRVVLADGDPRPQDGAVLAPPSAPGRPAYIAAGCAGDDRPAAATLDHHALASRLGAIAARYSLTPTDRVLVPAGTSYDVRLMHMLAPLLVGSTVVLPAEADVSAAWLTKTLAGEAVTVSILSADLWDALGAEWEHSPDALAHHRPRLMVVIDGRRAGGGRLERWTRRSSEGMRVLRLWDLSDAAAGAATLEVDPHGDRGSFGEVGRPAGACSFCVLDASGNPSPVGVAGEVFARGPGIPSVYAGDPALTAGDLVPDPLGAPGNRMLRTAVRARLRADGRLEVCGRLGRHVALSGFRVDLDVVEAYLADRPGVRGANVVVRDDPEGRPLLVAYVLPESGNVLRADALREAAVQGLPSYMVPDSFVLVDELPVAGEPGSGPVAEHTDPAPGSLRPLSPAENRIAAIWAEVLGLPNVHVDANFFALGGHSLSATRVVARIRDAFGIEIPLRAIFESPTVAQLATRVGLETSAAEPGLRRRRDADLRLSFAQERLWFLDEFQPGSAAYNIPSITRIQRPIDPAVMERALNEIVRRHEALRTTFPSVEGQAAQLIHESMHVPLRFLDLGDVPRLLVVPEVRRLAAAESDTPFELATGPLLRARLVRVAEDDHVLLFTIHHIVADGWAFDVLRRELRVLYDAFERGEPSPLPELRFQYADWAQWQRERLEGERLEDGLAYWRGALRGAPTMLELPFDRPGGGEGEVRGATHGFRIGSDVRGRVVALAREEGATTFMALLAAFGLLMHWWTKQRDIVIGTPIANRTKPELEEMIGLFVNTLPMRVTILPDDTFRTLVRRVREMALGAFAHQDMPFEKLVEDLGPERNLSRNPLFQVMFVMQNTPDDPMTDDGSDVLDTAPPPGGTSKFDISLFVTEGGERFMAGIEYNADVFTERTIHRLGRWFDNLLQHALADPDAPVDEIAVLDQAEVEALAGWSRGPDTTQAPSVPERVVAQAKAFPDAEAVVAGEVSWTYGELIDQASRIAGGVASRLGREARVGLCLERSADAIAAALGALLVGAYAPLDPSYPRSWLRTAIDTAGLDVVISQVSTRDLVPSGVATLEIEDLKVAEPISPGTIHPRSLAYLIHTSGSTGRPKCVAMPHRPVANLIDWQIRRSGLPPGARTLQFASLGFDVSFQEIFSTLSAGGCLVVCDEETRREPELVWALVREAGVARMFLPPVMLHLLAKSAGAGAAPGRLREILSAGEQLVVGDAVARLLEATPELRLYNQYGPSETHVVTEHCVGPADLPLPPIGRPLPGVSVDVLDDRLERVPPGVVGDVYVGGEALARGYEGDAHLTADRFVPDPFGTPGDRLYRTGDRARWREDGALDYVGREDDQVKVRGFRVEPAEVEAALERHPVVRKAAVSAIGRGPDRRLCAFVVPESAEPLDVTAVNRFLRELLPPHMIPSSYTTLTALPTTPSGKIDRKALPDPVPVAAADLRGAAAPRTPVEKALAEIWTDVLGVAEVSVHDDFFDLGGHSLLATQVVARARARLGVELPLRRLFEQPTIAGLAVEVVAEQLARAGGDATRELVEIGRAVAADPIEDSGGGLTRMDHLLRDDAGRVEDS